MLVRGPLFELFGLSVLDGDGNHLVGERAGLPRRRGSRLAPGRVAIDGLPADAIPGREVLGGVAVGSHGAKRHRQLGVARLRRMAIRRRLGLALRRMKDWL